MPKLIRSSVITSEVRASALIKEVASLNMLSKTYGPFTRCYDHPHWKTLTLEQRAKLMARQGQSFATAQDVRVVYPSQDENDEELRDVPKDGRTVGEVLMRGNIVMKEVRFSAVVPKFSYAF